MYKVAFGFDKGDIGAILTGRKKAIDHHCSIVCKIFVDPLDSEFTEDDAEELKDLFKNWIAVYVTTSHLPDSPTYWTSQDEIRLYPSLGANVQNWSRTSQQWQGGPNNWW